MAKAHGDGSLYFDERAQLWRAAVVVGTDANGKPKRKYVSSRSKTTARTKMRAALERREQGLPQDDERTTVAAWLEHWSEKILPRSVEPKTARDYRDVIAYYIVPSVGTVKLSKLRPDHVERMMSDLEARGYKPNTVRLARSVLRRALVIAERRHLVVRNVAALTDAPKQVKTNTSDALTVSEARAVLDTARGDRLEALAVLVLAVGLRQGEALALCWSDVDLEAATLTVRDGKTDASDATIPIPATVVDALRAHWSAQLEERVDADVWGNPDLVFASRVGTKLDSRNVLRWWHALTVRAGVGRRRFHASRHTAGTLLLNAGVPLEQVSAILRHANLAITSDIYAKPTRETLRSSVNVMDEVLGR